MVKMNNLAGAKGLIWNIIAGYITRYYNLIKMPVYENIVLIFYIMFLSLLVFYFIQNKKKIPISLKPVDSAFLRLHIYDDNQTPDKLADKNIFRWYFLTNMVLLHKETGGQNKVISQILFLTFEPEVHISSIKVRSPDIKLPIHEVKEFNQKFAIIAFNNKIPSGTLEILITS